MLKPVNALKRYATRIGMPEAVYAAKEKVLLAALLHPKFSANDRDGAASDSVIENKHVVALYAHGRIATRLLQHDRGYELQEWNFGQDDWVEAAQTEGGPNSPYEQAKWYGGVPLDAPTFMEYWASLDDAAEVIEPFDSRLKMAEFYYGTQCIDWDDRFPNPWEHLTDVATVVFAHEGKIPTSWDAKTRERVQETLGNLQLAWGEIEPVTKTVVDASPRYLVSVSSVTEPLAKLRPEASHARQFTTKVDREWMSGERMAETARQFGIDKASYPSPSYAEHVWWVSSTKPAVEGVLETRFQLDVHELTDSEAGFREPTAEDFQRIGNALGVPFDEPMVLPAPHGMMRSPSKAEHPAQIENSSAELSA